MEYYKIINTKCNFESINVLEKSNLNRKNMENYKFKKIQNFLKVYAKLEKTIIKFGDTETEKQKF